MSDNKILVVDDEPNVVRTLTFVLKKEGYDVTTAVNGEEALTKIKESKPNLMLYYRHSWDRLTASLSKEM